MASPDHDPVIAQLDQLVGEELGFSDIEGFHPEDFNYKCPTTDLPCREKLKLISQYTRDIDEVTVESGEAASDKRKLKLKLGEYSAWGIGIECIGEGRCQVRQAMNESVVRQTAVSGIRSLRRFL